MRIIFPKTKLKRSMRKYMHTSNQKIRNKIKNSCGYKYEVYILPFSFRYGKQSEKAIKITNCIEEIQKIFKSGNFRHKIISRKSRNINRVRILFNDEHLLIFLKLAYSDIIYKMYEISHRND